MGTSHRHPRRGLDLGCAQVCATEQRLAPQLGALAIAGISADRLYGDKRTVTTVDQPGLPAVTDEARQACTSSRIFYRKDSGEHAGRNA